MKNGTYDMREDAKSLGKLQDRLNTPCVKLGKPAPKFVEVIKKDPQISNQSGKKSRQFGVSKMMNLLSSWAKKCP